MLVRGQIDDPYFLGKRRTLMQDAQKVCPARPQASRNRRRYRPHYVGPFARTIILGERKDPSSTSDLRESHRYVEDFDKPRTKLAGFLSIPL